MSFDLFTWVCHSFCMSCCLFLFAYLVSLGIYLILLSFSLNLCSLYSTYQMRTYMSVCLFIFVAKSARSVVKFPIYNIVQCDIKRKRKTKKCSKANFEGEFMNKSLHRLVFSSWDSCVLRKKYEVWNHTIPLNKVSLPRASSEGSVAKYVYLLNAMYLRAWPLSFTKIQLTKNEIFFFSSFKSDGFDTKYDSTAAFNMLYGVSRTFSYFPSS